MIRSLRGFSHPAVRRRQASTLLQGSRGSRPQPLRLTSRRGRLDFLRIRFKRRVRLGVFKFRRSRSLTAYTHSTIRLWDWKTGNALSVLGEQGSFVYSLASIPSIVGGGLASSGEDGIIKIWNEEGMEEQQVLVPALSGAFSLSLADRPRLR